MRLKGKIAIVTGGARGIGRSIATRFAAEGASVIIADVDRDQAVRTVAELGGNRASVWSIPVDVTEPLEVKSLMQQTVTEFGRLDILVNNAGVGSCKPFLDTTLEEWERDLRVNLTGTFLCAQAAAREMLKHGGGHIVNIASISGQRGGVGRAAYGASKAGVILLTKVMAVELGERGICVNAVAPGPVDTAQSRATHTPATRRAYGERIPLGRYGKGEEIAAAVLFLASDEASFLAGHTLNADGGFDASGLAFKESSTEQQPAVLASQRVSASGAKPKPSASVVRSPS
jgi:3-oxoacyl-[acyl-carrier protein] reductase